MFSIHDYSDVAANQLNERRTALGGRENGNFGGGKEKEHKDHSERRNETTINGTRLLMMIGRLAK